MSFIGVSQPPLLQASVDHAQRLALVLEREESRPGHLQEVPAWLVGRSGELQQVSEALVRDWSRGSLSAEDAATALDAYVEDLHAGLATQLGIASPPCCLGLASSGELVARPEPPSAPLDSVDHLLCNLGGASSTDPARMRSSSRR